MTAPIESDPNWSQNVPLQQPSIVHVIMRMLLPTIGWMSLGWDLTGYTNFMFFLGSIMLLRAHVSRLETWIQRHYSCTIHTKRSSETYDMLLSWIASHEHGCNARSTIARIQTMNDNESGCNPEKDKVIRFDPWDGSFQFWFKNKLITFRSDLRDDGFHKEEVLSITCFGRSPKVLEELIEETRREYLDKNKKRTHIFENYGDSWRKITTKPIRPLTNVILGQEQMQLVDNMKDFLDPESQKEFAKLSQPYRKGYLLHGPPGTGKSSFSHSLAGEFSLDIYVTDLTSASDQALRILFSKLPRQCVVLLEDVDATSTSRSQDLNTSDETSKSKKSVSLSGLLNAIDGVASAEGRVLIMTTNYPEKLDAALIRPGRVDMKSEFQLADSTMAAQLFDFVYRNSLEVRGNRMGTDLALRFASRLPQWRFSPAEIMSFLTIHRRSSARALEEVDQWVATSLQEKSVVSTSREDTFDSVDEGMWLKRVHRCVDLQKRSSGLIVPPPSRDGTFGDDNSIASGCGGCASDDAPCLIRSDSPSDSREELFRLPPTPVKGPNPTCNIGADHVGRGLSLIPKRWDHRQKRADRAPGDPSRNSSSDVTGTTEIATFHVGIQPPLRNRGN